jgi:hypothetical protein
VIDRLARDPLDHHDQRTRPLHVRRDRAQRGAWNRERSELDPCAVDRGLDRYSLDCDRALVAGVAARERDRRGGFRAGTAQRGGELRERTNR